MYFLSEFCRICIKTSEELKDIESTDYDSIKFSEKLRACTKMVINRGSFSTLICISCINKLRISYEFDTMVKKSRLILQGYLSELLGSENSLNQFSSSELYVQLTKLPEQKKHRQYVTKEQRCSLLKELLTKIKDDKKHFKTPGKLKAQSDGSAPRTAQKPPIGKYEGLKALINFTKLYNYGYKIDEKKITNINYDSSSLDKLTQFVNTFFQLDLTRFYDNLSYVLEQSEEWSEDSEEETLTESARDESADLKFEEVIVEPDINIKKEVFVDESEVEGGVGYQEGAVVAKVEPEESAVTEYVGHNRYLAEIIPLPSRRVPYSTNNASSANTSTCRSNSELYPVLCESLDRQSTSNLNLLQRYTEQKFRKHRKEFSQSNAKCRTKDHPFISPQLKRQFLNQDFKCKVCNRRFKSQGYLHAHFSKMKHSPL